jgi:hypothetical protein
MQPNEIEALSDQFAVALAAKLPPHLAESADQSRLRELARPHVEGLSDGGKLEGVASLVADLLGELAPAPEGEDAAGDEDEGPARHRGHGRGKGAK